MWTWIEGVKGVPGTATSKSWEKYDRRFSIEDENGKIVAKTIAEILVKKMPSLDDFPASVRERVQIENDGIILRTDSQLEIKFVKKPWNNTLVPHSAGQFPRAFLMSFLAEAFWISFENEEVKEKNFVMKGGKDIENISRENERKAEKLIFFFEHDQLCWRKTNKENPEGMTQ